MYAFAITNISINFVNMCLDSKTIWRCFYNEQSKFGGVRCFKNRKLGDEWGEQLKGSEHDDTNSTKYLILTEAQIVSYDTWCMSNDTIKGVYKSWA